MRTNLTESPCLKGFEVAPSLRGYLWGKRLSMPFWHKTWLFLCLLRERSSEDDQTKGCSKMLKVKDLAMDDRKYLIEQKFGNSWRPRSCRE
jgi:hypothetical protein